MVNRFSMGWDHPGTGQAANTETVRKQKLVFGFQESSYFQFFFSGVLRERSSRLEERTDDRTPSHTSHFRPTSTTQHQRSKMTSEVRVFGFEQRQHWHWEGASSVGSFGCMRDRLESDDSQDSGCMGLDNKRQHRSWYLGRSSRNAERFWSGGRRSLV